MNTGGEIHIAHASILSQMALVLASTGGSKASNWKIFEIITKVEIYNRLASTKDNILWILLTFTCELSFHSRLTQVSKIEIHSLLVLLQNGWSFVVFPLQSYGLTYNFTFIAKNIYILIWKMLEYYPSNVPKIFYGNLNSFFALI